MDNDIFATGEFESIDFPFGNNIKLGDVKQSLKNVDGATQFRLKVNVDEYVIQ